MAAQTNLGKQPHLPDAARPIQTLIEHLSWTLGNDLTG